MIDSGASLRAATGIQLDALEAYLVNAGWQSRESKHGLSLFTKPISNGDASVEVFLPAIAQGEEVVRRVADALRTIASLEGRSVFDVADAIGASTLKPAIP